MHLRHLPILCLCAAAAAQGFLHLPASLNPATSELANYGLRPFAQVNSRVQMFFDATEVGAAGFLLDGCALRWDGPLPRVGAPGPFTIQQLTVRVGSTAVALPGASFEGNLTQPLTTAFQGPWSYFPDPGTAAPHGFGDPNGSLAFSFGTPIPIAIPPGGWFVLELAMQGNSMSSQGFAHTLLDGARVAGGPTAGGTAPLGQGCGLPGQPNAAIAVGGTVAPGAAHFVAGQHLGANTLVFALVGLDNLTSSFGMLPLALPGTACTLYGSAEFYWLLFSDAAGAIAPDRQDAALAVPPLPGLAGLVLYEQLLVYAPGANALGFLLSDARALTLGTLAPPAPGVYAVSHGAQHDAAVADQVEAFGYAVRLSLR